MLKPPQPRGLRGPVVETALRSPVCPYSATVSG